MFNQLYELSKARAVHTVWVMSDLQQSDPANMEKCLNLSMEDYVHYLGSPAEEAWYLGDAVEGADLNHLIKMTARHEEAFVKLGIPLCYAPGNHDFDYSARYPDQRKEPFSDMIRSHPGWQTSAKSSDFYFRRSLGDFEVFFLCDHMAEDRSWCVTHGVLRWGKKEDYPYTRGDMANLGREMSGCGKKVITASHCAFPGGNRQSALWYRILPVANNVKLHLYGHAHIGDAIWAVRDVYRRISWVDYHDIPQVNVSSFENIRGDKCRSVILHIYADGQMGIFFRNHDDHTFTEAYFPAPYTYSERMEETVATVSKIHSEHPDWNIGNEAYREDIW